MTDEIHTIYKRKSDAMGNGSWIQAVLSFFLFYFPFTYELFFSVGLEVSGFLI